MNGTNYEVPHCGAFSTPHSHPSWAQIFVSGSCFQIPVPCLKISCVTEIVNNDTASSFPTRARTQQTDELTCTLYETGERSVSQLQGRKM